jgi:hypothetical protein
MTIDEILEALCALDDGPRHRPVASRCEFDRPSGALRPDRRPIAMDKAIAYPNDLSDQAIAQALRAQVQAWRATKPDRRNATDTGVPVVRRRRMQTKQA